MRRIGCSAALTLSGDRRRPSPCGHPGGVGGRRAHRTALYMGGSGHPLSLPQDTTQYITSYVRPCGWQVRRPIGIVHRRKRQAARPLRSTPPSSPSFMRMGDLTFDESAAIGRANLDACLRGNLCTVTSLRTQRPATGRLTDTSYVVFGYSESGTIASMEKSWLIAHPSSGSVSFVLMSNPGRPNGGILERFVGAHIPILGVTFSGATPTNSPERNPLTTVDVARQYDPVSDFPTNPLNLLADRQCACGALYVHPEAGYFAADDLQLQGQYQDTTYYLAPTATLPLLMPLAQLPVIGPTLAARTRSAASGPRRSRLRPDHQPGPADAREVPLLPQPDQDGSRLRRRHPDRLGRRNRPCHGDPANRPFHTAAQPDYGVGGPPVDTGRGGPYPARTPAAATTKPARPMPTASATRATTPARPPVRKAHAPNVRAPRKDAPHPRSERTLDVD